MASHCILGKNSDKCKANCPVILVLQGFATPSVTFHNTPIGNHCDRAKGNVVPTAVGLITKKYIYIMKVYHV